MIHLAGLFGGFQEDPIKENRICQLLIVFAAIAISGDLAEIRSQENRTWKLLNNMVLVPVFVSVSLRFLKKFYSFQVPNILYRVVKGGGSKGRGFPNLP